MVAERTLPDISYTGSAARKKLAQQAFEAIRAQGMFSSDFAPIRVKMAGLAEFLGASESDIRAAVEANAHIFALDEHEEATYVVSSRLGVPPIEMIPDSRHSFAARFMSPEPAPERPLRTEKPVQELVVNTEIGEAIDDAEDERAHVEEELRVEDGVDVGEDIKVELVSDEPADTAELDAPPEAHEAEEVAPEQEAVVEEVEAEPEVVAEPEPETGPALSDLSALDDDAVAAAIDKALRSEGRVANFGNSWMPEDRVERLSRGNLRSLADYINEQEQPLTDDVLVQDVLGVRRSSPNFATIRFSMNYRLASERNFEFLGTADQPFWGTSDLPPIGTTRRKASDIGTDYRFLVEEAPVGSAEPRSVKSVEHTLSFYEFTYGLLPLDAKMQALLPAPMMPDQRSAVLMVEIPQFENSVYLVEVRYPTHNRGGVILGLDDFYDEKLVPGAMLSIEATDNDGQYKIEYLEDDERQDRFLELDDRRAPKYVFRPLSYDTAVADEWMVTESRFPGFNSEKPLSEKQRRRIEEVVEATIRRIGEQDGDASTTTFSDLLVAVNVERPASEAFLRSAIESMASLSDDGSGILTYEPTA